VVERERDYRQAEAIKTAFREEVTADKHDEIASPIQSPDALREISAEGDERATAEESRSRAMDGMRVDPNGKAADAAAEAEAAAATAKVALTAWVGAEEADRILSESLAG
jgi:ribosomal protein L16 Arg81 hydroxylase